MRAAIVTGVSRGLGRSARRSDARARICGARRRADGEREAQGQALPLRDLRSGAALADRRVGDACAAQARRRTEPDSVTLINNAAVPTPTGLVGHLDAAEIETALTTNAAAAVVMADLFCRTFATDAIERRIINISSGAAQTAIPGSAVYSMSKAAIEMLTRSIAAEHDEPRFRCISLRPGIFETGMQAYMRSRDPAEFPSVGMFRGFKENGLLKDPADVAARIVDRLVIGHDRERANVQPHRPLSAAAPSNVISPRRAGGRGNRAARRQRRLPTSGSSPAPRAARTRLRPRASCRGRSA